jgi:uncharacterized membrane protein
MILRRLSHKLKLRVTLFALLSVGTAAIAILAEDMIPATLRRSFSPDTVLPILTILASGMLAVSTFSLDVMVTAHNAAAGQTAPRVHGLLLAETTTQTVLATFIGAFVYALAAIILFKAGFYPERLRVALLRLSDAPDPALAEAAGVMAARALDHADATLALESERARLRATGDGISFLP